MVSSEFARSSLGLVISLSMLFVLPASVAALLVFLTDMSGKKARTHYTRFPIWMMGIILVSSALILREGVICVLMVTPFWWLGAWFGSRAVYRLQEKYKVGGGLNCLMLAALPFLTLFAENQLPQPSQEIIVTRSIIIDASAENIWPLLVQLNDIQPDEGRWNITQDLLGVPRPSMASLDLSVSPPIRHAKWGENISFEEHVTQFEVNQKMGWDFVFPNDSVSQYTDRHISADGYHLKIKSGSYEMVARSPSQTELILTTEYRATSPVNFYAKLWGELILGDIQENILNLIQSRANSTASFE